VDLLAPRRLASVLGFVLALALAAAATATAAPAVNGNFPVSGLDANNKLVEGPDGSIWVTLNSATDDVARITPGGKVEEFDLENITSPTGIAVGPEKRIWVTENEAVASFSTAQPTKTTKTTIAQVKAGAPIVAGPDGQMWVATEGFVLHFPPTEPANLTPITVAGLSPKDIDVGGSLIVVSDFANPRIVTLTTAGTEVDIPIAGGSQGVAGATNGQVAFSQQGTEPEQFGLATPPGKPALINVPASDPFGIAVGSDGAYWGVQSNKDGVLRITPGGETKFVGGFPAGSMPRQIASGPNNTMWVTLTQTGATAVGRISGLEPPRPTDIAPETTITKGPRKLVKTRRRTAKVSFRFESNLAGSSFECALVKLGRKHGSPAFRACNSPKAYRLRPGRYSFSVRAVSVGVADPTPAKRSFRVVRVHRRHHRHHR
jgi:streptogramin lyase